MYGVILILRWFKKQACVCGSHMLKGDAISGAYPFKATDIKLIEHIVGKKHAIS